MKSIKMRFQLYAITFLGIWIVLITFDSCQYSLDEEKIIRVISESEVIAAQEAWELSLISIGVAYENGGDYKATAKKHVQDYYGYDLGKVLFKPTMAKDKQFRTTFDGALSYYVGGNDSFPEDKGFALNRWTNVRWENVGIFNSNGNMAIAMGNQYFIDKEGKELKVEFTLCYVKDKQGNLKIVAHKSALPFSTT